MAIKRPTKRQRSLMARLGVPVKKGMTRAEAAQAIGLRLDFLPKNRTLRNMTYEDMELYEMDESDFSLIYLDEIWGD